MNILSICDGLSGARIALDSANIKVDNYFASEVDKPALKIANKNYPDNINLGDCLNWAFWNLPEIDLLIGGTPCFTAGSFVMTSNGYTPIEDIKVGDMVLTHKGRFQKVLKTGTSIKPIVNIKSQGSIETGTTKTHPFYCTTKIKTWDNKKRNYNITYSDFYWKNIEEFDKNDKCVSPKWQINKDIPEFSDMDLYILGRFLADGCCFKTKRKNRKNSYLYRFKIAIGKHKLEAFKSKVDDRFYYSKERTAWTASINRQEWVELGEKFGKGAGNKFIPNFILKLPIERLKIFIDGYMSGDGCIYPNHKKATTVSPKLALTFSLAIQKCYQGISIFKCKKPKTCVIENRVVNQKDSYEISYSEKDKKGNNFVKFENNIAYNLSKYEETNIEQLVYNLEVEKDNSYIVNNIIVHNCQGFSFAGKQLNFKDDRSKLFFIYVDILKAFKPKYFLLENVPMKKEYQDIISNILGVQPIEINSSLVSAQNRKRLYWTNIPNVTQPDDKCIVLKGILDTNASFGITPKELKHITKPYKLKKKYAAIDGDKAITLTAGGVSKWNATYISKCLHIGDAEDIKGFDIIKRIYSIDGKSPTLTTCQGGHREPKIAMDETHYRKLTPIECERLQTLPDNYTQGVSNTQRYKMIGNGFTVDVIAHILDRI